MSKHPADDDREVIPDRAVWAIVVAIAALTLIAPFVEKIAR